MNLNVPDIPLSRRVNRETHPSRAVGISHRVTKGDTLSGIVRGHLKKTGQDHSASAIYRAVKQVAKSNGMADPDKLSIGQRVRLDSLGGTSQRITNFRDVLHSAPSRSTGADSNPFHRVLGGPARMSSPYGIRKHPITHDHRHHNGIDLAATKNTPITPLRPGIVTFSGWLGGYGNTVIVEHEDGLSTQYSHAASRNVREGQSVNDSTVLATVGATGNATGAHLHLEVTRNGRRVNPLPYLMTEPTLARGTRFERST